MKHSQRMHTQRSTVSLSGARGAASRGRAPSLYSAEPGGAALWVVAGLGTILLLGALGYVFTSGMLDKYFFGETPSNPPTAVASPQSPTPTPTASGPAATPSSPEATGTPTPPPSSGPAANNNATGLSIESSGEPTPPSAEGFVVTLDSTPPGAVIVNEAGVELGKTPQTLVLEDKTTVTIKSDSYEDFCTFAISSRLRGQTVKCSFRKPLAGAAAAKDPPEATTPKTPAAAPPVSKPPATKQPKNPKPPSSSPTGNFRSNF